MNLELRFFATFREAIGQKTLHRDFDDGATVQTVLESTEEEFPDLRGEFLQNGELQPQLNVLKNGREVLHIDGLDTELEDGDTLSVFPPVAGG